MKFLFKVTKMLPRLETESEIIPTILAIRRILKAEELDWHDVAKHLSDFVTSVAGAEEPAIEPPRAAGPSNGETKGWTRATQPQTPPFRPSRPQAPPRPQGPPPPPPHYPAGHARHIPKDLRARGPNKDKAALVGELLVRKIWQLRSEETFLTTIKLLLESGLPITRKQQLELEEIVDRL